MTGISASVLPVYLLVFGVGGVIGMQIGGRIGDRGVMAVIIGSFTADMVVFLVLLITVHSVWLASVTMFLWGFSFYFMAAPLQLRIVDAARGAPNLASTVIQSTFNLGIALGPVIGALILAVGAGYAMLPIAGALLSMLGVLGALWSRAMERRTGGLLQEAIP